MKRACQAELDRARELRSQGLGYHEVGAAIGRSDYSIRLWEKRGWKVGVNARPNPPEAEEASEAPAIAEAPAATVPPEAPALERTHAGLDGDDELARAVQLQNEQFAFATESRKMGNMTAAQRAMRDAAALAPVIARLRKARADGRDGTLITAAELAAAKKAFYDRLAILAAQPIYCAHCGRDLRIATAETDVSAEAT